LHSSVRIGGAGNYLRLSQVKVGGKNRCDTEWGSYLEDYFNATMKREAHPTDATLRQWSEAAVYTYDDNGQLSFAKCKRAMAATTSTRP
jgi:hypothetical protein